MGSLLSRWIAKTDRFWNFLLGGYTPSTPTRIGRKIAVEWLEDRAVPDGRPLPFPVIFAGSGPGSPAVVRAFNAETGDLTFERPAFESSFTGGVNVAAADITGDGYPDAILSPGTGGGPRVRVLNGKTGEQIGGPAGNFLAYDPAFVGGVSVAAADVSGDGTPEIITAAGAGGGPHVKVFNGRTGKVLDSFFALDPDFRGGITVGAADYTGDRRAEVVVGAGFGGGPRVRVLDLTTGRAIRGPLGDFFAADPGRRSGVSVGTDALAGDVNGDRTPDLVTGSGIGEASRVVVYSGRDGSVLSDFSPFGTEMTAGVRVATAFVTDDATADVVVGTGPGVEGRVRVFDGATGRLIDGPMADFAPFGAGYTGGVAVAASNDPPPDGPLTQPYSETVRLWPDQQGEVKVTVTVTPDAPGYSGLYLWEYFVQNVAFGGYGGSAGTGAGMFNVLLEDSLVNDVANVANSVNEGYTWGGGITGFIGWWNGTTDDSELTLRPGENAEFQFTTPPRKLDYVTTEVWTADYGVGVSGKITGPSAKPFGDLDIIDSNGTVVVENMEENPGGWVPVNNDNDNYNFYGASPEAIASSIAHIYDMEEATKVVTENDLVHIKVHSLNPWGTQHGTYKLVWTSPKIKVWKSADKDGGQVTSGVELFAAEDHHFWVEGLQRSDAALSEQIRLIWTSFTTQVELDKVNFTVYRITGAMNVPGYSRELYRVEAPSGYQPEFVSVSGGQKVTEVKSDFGNGAVTSVSILWNEGPVVGSYRVIPAGVVPNFYIDRAVNVVKIEVDSGAMANNRLFFSNKMHQDPADRVLIVSTDGVSPAVFAVVNIAKIEGPVVNGQTRGVRFMEMGIIQNGRWTKKYADYDGFVPRKRLTSTLEKDQFYLDADEDDEESWPWYSIDEGYLPDSVGYYAPGFDPPAPVVNKKFSIDDSPSQLLTDPNRWDWTIGTPPNQVTDQVDRATVVLDFKIFFAVATKDPSVADKKVYTQRASTTWQYDASGTIAINDTWTLTGKGVWSIDPTFSIITDGRLVDVTDGPVNNSFFATEVWTESNQP